MCEKIVSNPVSVDIAEGYENYQGADTQACTVLPAQALQV